MGPQNSLREPPMGAIFATRWNLRRYHFSVYFLTMSSSPLPSRLVVAWRCIGPFSCFVDGVKQISISGVSSSIFPTGRRASSNNGDPIYFGGVQKISGIGAPSSIFPTCRCASSNNGIPIWGRGVKGDRKIRAANATKSRMRKNKSTLSNPRTA